MIEYKFFPLSLSGKDAFTEASREELRVLLALIEANGRAEDTNALAALASVSKARCSAALVLWEEAGVIKKAADSEHIPTITEEFEERFRIGEIQEESSLNVAKSIRDNNLHDLINECAAIMNRSSLTTSEVKNITALYEQYALSEEYILTLAAYIAESGRLTVTKLINKATDLATNEVETIEALKDYITKREADNRVEREFRKIFEIKGRSTSRKEKEYFKKWSSVYGYYTEIVGEAYQITLDNAQKKSPAYADKILTRWYETGCKTLSECISRYEADGIEIKEAAKKRKETASAVGASAKTKKEPERYGNFDVNDAFMKALDRSYGTSDKEKTDS